MNEWKKETPWVSEDRLAVWGGIVLLAIAIGVLVLRHTY
jgi:hypothetical protein